MVNEYVTNISDNFLPGPITLILKSKKEFLPMELQEMVTLAFEFLNIKSHWS